MINEERQKKYCCESLSEVEGYDEAIKDTTQVWEIHHRAETDLPCCGMMPTGEFSHKDLIKYGLYWHRPAKELIFVTSAEHNKIHGKARGIGVRRFHNTPEKLKQRAERKEEQARKHRELIEANKIKNCETYKRLGEERRKGRWFTDGKTNHFGTECPDGFHLGFTMRKPFSEEHRENLRKNHPHLKTFLGRHHTEESKKKMSEVHKRENLSDETRRKMSKSQRKPKPWLRGRHISEETRRKISQSKMGRVWSEEEKKRMSEYRKGLLCFNNGVKTIRARECPEGFVRGRLKKERVG